MNRGFGSDNHSGVHPLIMESLLHANTGHAPSYGTDAWSEKAIRLFRDHFGQDAQVFFVFNGTAANVLSLRALAKPYQAIFCSDSSHLHIDECGAPEFFAGCKLWVLPSSQGKIQIQDLEKNWIRRGDQHFSQHKVLSLTQPTEVGTVYTMSELKTLIDWAQDHDMYVHIDGARLANAALRLGVGFKQMTTDLGVDVVSFGGTKNGLMMGEAVIFLNPSLALDFSYIRKQSAQLPSKTRFLAAQFSTYLENDLWKEIAGHSLNMAQALYHAVRDSHDIQIMYPVESNAVFARIPQKWISPLRKDKFFYVWDEKTFECRWMTSWDTTESDIDSFKSKIKELSK